MNSVAKGVVIVVGLVIIGSLLGLTSLAGVIALVGLLVVVLGLALGQARPTWRGERRGRAHRLSYLGRYGEASWATIILASLAVAAVLETVDEARTEVLVTVAIVAAIVYVVSSRLAGAVYGAAGAGVTLIALVVGTDGCPTAPDRLGPQLLAMTVGIVVVAAVVAGARFAPFPIPVPRSSVGPGESLLLVFGVLDVLAFLVAPAGLSIWESAPAGTRWLAVALLAVVAVFGVFGPRFVLGLAALGAGTATVYLALVNATGSGSEVECVTGWRGVAIAVVFAVAAGLGSALRPASDSQ